MAYLQSFFRKSRLARTGESLFGSYEVSESKSSEPSFLIFTPKAHMEHPDCRTARSRRFSNAMEALSFKLTQAELHDDFGDQGKNLFTTDGNTLNEDVAHFIINRSKIYGALNDFKKKGENRKQIEKEIEKWFKNNQPLVNDFLKNLDAVYKLRTTSAKVKEICFELAETFIHVLICVGIAAVAIKAAGAGLFGGAFAYLVAPAATQTLVIAGTAAASAAATGVFKLFRSESREIKAAIEKDLQTEPNNSYSFGF